MLRWLCQLPIKIKLWEPRIKFIMLVFKEANKLTLLKLLPLNPEINIMLYIKLN
jgi:hypothetical protein